MTKTSPRVRIGSIIASNTWKNLASKMSSTDEDEVKENLVEEAYQYLTRKSYPAGASEGQKRCIRRKAAKFVLKNGELFFKKMSKGKVRLGQSALNCCFLC